MGIGLSINSIGDYEEVSVPEGYTPPWYNGGCYANVGDGNPINAVLMPRTHVLHSGDLYHPEYLDLREFSVPVDVVAANFRIYTNDDAVNLWRHLIYRKSDRAKMWDSGYTSCVHSGWNGYSMNNIVLEANVPYWYSAKSANDTDNSLAFLTTYSFAFHKKFYGNYGKAPIGNLNIGLPVNSTAWLPAEQVGTIPDVLPEETSDSLLWGINLDLPIGFICTF